MSETVAAALSMFQRYLDEEIPPSAASYALATLMAQPPDVLMQQVATWTADQNCLHATAACDLLLHALKRSTSPASCSYSIATRWRTFSTA